MPEGMDAPPRILPALSSLIRHVVPRDRQTEFANTRLSDPAYVAGLGF